MRRSNVLVLSDSDSDDEVIGVVRPSAPPRTPLKSSGAALAMTGLGGGGLGSEFVGGGIDGKALLGLADKVACFVKVDVVRGAGAVQMGTSDGAVKDVEVLRGIRSSGVRARDAENVAEFGQEHLIVRPLGSA